MLGLTLSAIPDTVQKKVFHREFIIGRFHGKILIKIRHFDTILIHGLDTGHVKVATRLFSHSRVGRHHLALLHLT